MTLKSVEVHVRNLAPLAILDLGGDITNQAEADLGDAYTKAVATDPVAVALNFTAVEYINSTGIALLVGLLARARTDNRRIVAYGVSDHYTEIFRITRLADFMTLYPDEEAAMSDLTSTD